MGHSIDMHLVIWCTMDHSVVCAMVVDHGAVGVSPMDQATTKTFSMAYAMRIHGGHTTGKYDGIN